MKNIMVLEFENGQFAGAESRSCAETREGALQQVVQDNWNVEWDEVHSSLGSAIDSMGRSERMDWHLASLLSAPSDDGFLRLYMHETMKGDIYHRLCLWC
jgi:hypothetical protein